jgi:hypothetical protein
MAADTIIIKYKADTADFSKSLNNVTTDLTKAGIAGDKAGDKTAASFNKAATAINKTDTQTKKTTGAFNGMASSLTSIAGSLGVAFGVQQIIQFGKASAEAFIDAEKNAQLLLFALKGNEAAQGRLMAQATELQNTTIFDDDTIQQAQTFLANQGRTEEQIKKVINAAVELSTVTGVDLNTAVMQLDGTFEGQIGKMGKLDSGFKSLTKEQLANGAAADLLIEKYGGTAKAMGETTAGQAAKLKNQFGELQETIGGKLVPVISNMTEGLVKIFDGNATGGIVNYLDHMELIFPMIQEVREALQAFKDGKILEGIGNSFEVAASTITAGFYTRIKNAATGMDEVVDSLTDYEKAIIAVSNASDDEVTAKFEALGGATNATAMEFKKFTDEMRQGILLNTLNDLKGVLQINETQFKSLTDQTDKYKISVQMTADAILELRNASKEELEATFLAAQKELKVTREDFDKYIGTVKGLETVNDGAGKSTTKLAGAYDTLTGSVSKSMKALQDQATLFTQGKVGWESVIKLAEQYAKGQNDLVIVNDTVIKSLQRTTQEALLPLGDAMGYVLTQDQAMINQFKMSDELVQRRNEIFTELGLIKTKTTQQQLEELDKLEEAEISAADVSIANIQRIMDKYDEARQVIKINQFIEDAAALQGALSQVAEGLSSLFVGAARDSAEFVAFQKTVTLLQVALSSAQAIASGIAAVTRSSATPVEIIVGIASIVAGITSAIGAVASTVSSLQTPEVPQFFEGTDYLQLNGNPKGKDTIPVMAHEGEAIIPTDKNLKEPGLAKAWINGNLDKYVIDKWVSPALVAQEQAHKKDFANDIAASMMLQSGSAFDDYRLYRLGLDQVNLLSQNNKLLGNIMKSKNPWAI